MKNRAKRTKKIKNRYYFTGYHTADGYHLIDRLLFLYSKKTADLLTKKGWDDLPF